MKSINAILGEEYAAAIVEQQRFARAQVLHHLHQALEHLRTAQHLNHFIALALDLPPEGPITSAINDIARQHREGA